ncbi:CPBP family intramembrane glutamic endopeptidase [Streptococcus castoreus]|uniref:CPBP family intramembrane glutamic endopeptidase n=1 Tax=Streptococcus castoreus TaxID=254786 RepID=UPI0004002A0D|nr:type II CAAX endopeptidase family protein [Streptococcus castoreus]
MPLFTQCLNLCLLLVTVCPSIPMQAIFGKVSGGYGFNLIGFLRAVLVYYLIALMGIYLLSPQLGLSFGAINGKLIFMGLGLSVLILVIEVAFLHGLRCWQKQQWLPLNLSFVGTTQEWDKLGYPLLLAVCEEITYRFLWFHVLFVQWQLPLIVVLAATSCCYALNHLLMGKSIFYAKLVTGLIYGSLYHLTGSLWLVMLIHVTSNLLVECLGHLQARHKKVVD